MKKVLALVLAVLMVSTTAFAAAKVATISPAGTVKFDADGIVLNGRNGAGITELNVGSTSGVSVQYLVDRSGALINMETGNPATMDSGDAYKDGADGANFADAYASAYTKAELKAMLEDLKKEETQLKKDQKKNDLTAKAKKAIEERLAEIAKEKKAIEAAQTKQAGGVGGKNVYIKSLGDMIFRSVTNENYTVTSLKVTTGKPYVAGVSISDADEQVKLSFVKDLGNVTPKDFDVSFTLKGKGKMIIRNTTELNRLKEFTNGNDTKRVKDTATIPSVKFQMSGKVCYGKVQVNLGTYTDEDLQGLEGQAVDKNAVTLPSGDPDTISLEDDIVNFTYGGTFAEVTRKSAGTYVADAILTEEYDEGLTMEARVYSGDTLYLYCDNEPGDLVDLLDTGDGDVDFYFFHENTKYTTLNTNARLIFNETEEGDHVYSYKNGKLTEVGEYDEDEGCIVVRARTLGQYITSDIALDWLEIATSDDVENPDTGANDVVGIAAALAAVALVSAAAVSLKK